MNNLEFSAQSAFFEFSARLLLVNKLKNKFKDKKSNLVLIFLNEMPFKSLYLNIVIDLCFAF